MRAKPKDDVFHATGKVFKAIISGNQSKDLFNDCSLMWFILTKADEQYPHCGNLLELSLALRFLICVRNWKGF